MIQPEKLTVVATCDACGAQKTLTCRGDLLRSSDGRRITYLRVVRDVLFLNGWEEQRARALRPWRRAKKRVHTLLCPKCAGQARAQGVRDSQARRATRYHRREARGQKRLV